MENQNSSSKDISSKFCELLAKSHCNQCKKDVTFRFLPGQFKVEHSNGINKFMITNGINLTCKGCNTSIKLQELSEIKAIEKPFIFQMSIFFPEFYFDSQNINFLESEWAKKKIARLFNINQENVALENCNFQQLIKLFTLGKTIPRVKDFLTRLTELFSKRISPNYKSAYHLLISGSYFTNGMIGNSTDDIYNTISQVIFSKRWQELNQEDQKRFVPLPLYLKQLYYLNQRISFALFHEQPVQIVELYNFVEKINEIYNKIFNFMPVTLPKNQPLEIYSKLRNSIAHSNIIFQNNQEILLDIDSDENYLGIIGDVEKIKDELIIIAGILSQITALYQIINQTYNS